jgi:Domain of unknown function (DUF1707)
VDDRRKMRASDRNRQDVVDRLRAALDDGRLKMDEYVERMGLAYQAVTHGDLMALYDDLPERDLIRTRETAPLAPAPPSALPAKAPGAAVARQGLLADLPGALKVLWTIWLVAVSVNVVIWVLVSGSSGHLIYPWPLWVAGPYGAALFAVSAGVRQSRRSRRTAGRDQQAARP